MAIKDGKYGRSKLTSVWLNIDDYTFCKQNNLSFAQIFRDKIRELKTQVSSGQEKTDTQRINDLKKTITEMYTFLENNKLLAAYAEASKPLNNGNN